MSAHIPAALKRLLLPLWNGLHHRAWRLGEYLDAIRHGRVERCDVCGRRGLILHRRWVIPSRLEQLWGLPPRLAEALARKESCDCSRCGAKLRVRRLARAILEIEEFNPSKRASIAEWVQTPSARSLDLAEINLIGGLHEQLAHLPKHRFSDYFEGATPGSVVQGIRHEDLTRLTYPDESFDLVLTSETLEHVPDLGQGLAEIRRILRPGGRHIFTVPLLPSVEKTFARKSILGTGGILDLATPISHPGGDWGYPVFTEFGLDFEDLLRKAGFEAEIRFGPVTEDDLGQVFVTRRRN